MVPFQYTGKYFRKCIALPVLFFLFLLPATNSPAETRYVSDQLTINVKDNLEQPYTVVAKVRSNEAVNVLEENDGYARIQTADRQIGWIARQYLTTTVPKTVVIERLQREIAALRTQIPQSGSTATPPAVDSELRKERDRLQLELETARTRITELQAQAAQPAEAPAPPDPEALSSEIMVLVEKRTQLETEITALRAQIESLNDGRIDIDALVQEKERLVADNRAKDQRITVLTAENDKLAEKTIIYWFMAGALVFLGGMFSGKLFSRKKAKYSY
ncbi:TIGR04211 family SH3 domain-containing protein [Desulfoprunum benzoelyticum]|uniref:SH3 domain protein n=1 Tax=Desulfoprunum benzoelyticum TaxID=1506996 RepID=A0A840UKV7_9BACT|nr:TIGR04211 family SH3 domain-containing protein [Desulfoprunum benzoelyticum]MBB5346392.1 SH3 domain protein [Desulfoprunum benzoelyticum]MBM9528609.1 TIGR04211 family SH3 domain-containing protein [Desulfoprunum benzoelyticum]